MKYNILAVISTIALSNMAFAKCPSPLNLKDFKSNPKAFMNAHIQKFDKDCQKTSFSVFSAEQIATKSYVANKDGERKSMCHLSADGTKKVCLGDIEPGEDVLSGRAPIESLDQASNLVTGRVIRNLKKIEEMGLTEGKVANQPWSDWYWPIAVGQLSYRYNDTDMTRAYSRANPGEEDVWKWFVEYNEQNPATPADPNKLSPSEKYDLLVGDTNYTLTKTQLEAGRYYQDNFGKVEGWMGLCHGWAPASYMLDRPVKSIEVLAADQATKIEFLPSDLKALGTLLWGKGIQSNKFVGGRCNTKDPETDSNGRILDQECFDNNPGSWHMTVTSQVGKNKVPFVMDATFDYEVWNHPVTSYQYTYFNPITMDEVDTLEEAIVAVEDFSDDKFKEYRGSRAKFIVGIVMEVEYLVETMPSKDKKDFEYNDAFHSAHYTYDLELDTYGNIIGGEWYTNEHPDFLWTPYENSHARSVADEYIQMEEFPLELLSHSGLRQLVPYASERSQPIGKIVEALFREASK